MRNLMRVANVNVHYQCSSWLKFEVLVLHSVFHVVVRCDVVEKVNAEGRRWLIEYDVNGDSVQMHTRFKLDCSVPRVSRVFVFIISEN